MKPVHHNTRRAIERRAIRDYEERTRLVVTVQGLRFLDYTIAQGRLMRLAQGQHWPADEIRIETDVGEPWRRVSVPIRFK